MLDASDVLIQRKLITCVLLTCVQQSTVQEVRLPRRHLLGAPLDVTGVHTFAVILFFYSPLQNLNRKRLKGHANHQESFIFSIHLIFLFTFLLKKRM